MTDANHQPYLTPENVVVSMVEDWEVGVPFVQLNFTDDEHDVLWYTVLSTIPFNISGVQPHGGLYPLRNIRKQRVPSFNVTLNVTDSGTPTGKVKWVVATVMVIVIEQNHCPNYTGAPVLYAYENSPIGLEFARLTSYEYDIPDVNRHGLVDSCAYVIARQHTACCLPPACLLSVV